MVKKSLLKIEIGMLANVRYKLGGKEFVDAAEIYNVTKSGYCYVRRIDKGWLGVKFKIGEAWPLLSPERKGYQLELPA